MKKLIVGLLGLLVIIGMFLAGIFALSTKGIDVISFFQRTESQPEPLQAPNENGIETVLVGPVLIAAEVSCSYYDYGNMGVTQDNELEPIIVLVSTDEEFSDAGIFDRCPETAEFNGVKMNFIGAIKNPVYRWVRVPVSP